ncbi:CU044_5270 family protein [Streptomyces avicenniae]|uniref:CU044_5270 family protein n=1 Tax=Streptomyces avicenniae TaxID=500153 RepID=UPI00167E2254|nr:CU044_5270 family protein [Streptomyces avicenniae]
MGEITREQERADGPAALAARPWRRRAPWVAIPVAAALVAGVVTYAVTDGDDPAAHTGVVASGTPAQFLSHVLDSAEEVPVPRADQYIYVRQLNTFRGPTIEEMTDRTDQSGQLGQSGPAGVDTQDTPHGITVEVEQAPMLLAVEPYESERWISPDGTRGWTIDPFDEMNTDGEGRSTDQGPWEPYLEATTYDFLAGLPTDAEGLWDRVYGEFGERDGLTGDVLDQRAFRGFGDLAFGELLPPGLAAGLYEAIGQVPGVQLLEGIEDAAGRAAVGVARVDQETGTRPTYLFDPETYDYLGFQEVQVETRDGVEAGTLLQNFTVLERAVVDEVRQRPGEGGGAA